MASAVSEPAVNPFEEWVPAYRYNVLDFCREVLGFEPDRSTDPEQSDGQLDIILAYEAGLIRLRDNLPPDGAPADPAVVAVLRDLVRQISVVSGHGTGKTAAMAVCIIHHACCFFPQRVVCTSATEKQLFNALASEVKAWIKHLPQPVQDLFNITGERISLKAFPERSYIAFQTSSKENTEALAGVHEEHILLIVDEASGVPDPVLEGASGSMSSPHALLFLTGNPVRSQGEFFRSHNDPTTARRWVRLHLDCRFSPRVSPTWIEEMAEKYGEDSNAFRVRVTGQFPLKDDESLISRELVTQAITRQVERVPSALRAWGLDCARFGRDRTALVMRAGNVVEENAIHVWGGLDTMQTVGRVKFLYDSLVASERPTEINVDVIGIGAGVVDRLRELGLPARGINVGETASVTGLYGNLKTELWVRARDWFLKRDCRIPGDQPDLVDELCAPSYTFASSGKMMLESKDKVRKRLHMASPDIADAFVLTFAGDAVTGLHGRVEGAHRRMRRHLRGIV